MPTAAAQLRRVGSRQIDRCRRDRKQLITRRFDETTHPGLLLTDLIPRETDHRGVTKPGSLASDLVAQSGASAAAAGARSCDSFIGR